MRSSSSAVWLLAIALLAVGCPRPKRSGLSYGSESDVEKMLATHGAPVKVAACENVRYVTTSAGTTSRDDGTTRALSCMATLTAAQASAFATSFTMTAVTTPRGPSSGPSKTGECETRGFAIGAPGIESWEIRGRAKSDGWEYVELRYERSTGRACVQTQYAWS